MVSLQNVPYHVQYIPHSAIMLHTIYLVLESSIHLAQCLSKLWTTNRMLGYICNPDNCKGSLSLGTKCTSVR